MVKYIYGEQMKTTIEIPEKIFRQAKSRAALEGISLREFFLRGLQLAIQSQPGQISRNRITFPLVKASQENPALTDDQVYAELNNDEELGR
jgi:hypothetical protein